MTSSESSHETLSSYHQYKGIFRLIDENCLAGLSTHYQLETKLNEKERGVTPLFLACMRKYVNIVHFLLQYGADPNIECKTVTPLYLACLYAEKETVSLLLEFGANPNVLSTSRNISPLHLAASKGLISETKLLIEHKANVNILSPRYGTPLHVAASKNHFNIATILINNGATVNDVNAEGETPLHICSRFGHLELLKLITNNKTANATIKDFQEGNTALHLACFHAREEVALYLISKFPEVIYVRNNERQTSLFYAPDSVRRAIKNTFSNKVKGFVNAINNKTFSDVTFLVENKPVYAHSCILFYRCGELLKNPKSNSERIVIKNVEHSVFLAVLSYLYTDDIDCEQNLLDKVGSYATSLKLTRLAQLCSQVKSTNTFTGPVSESTFKEDMKKMVNNPQFADVEFLVDGKKIYAHRRVLCHQEYFRAMFLGHGQLQESQTREVPITNVRYEIFYILIYYTYTWAVPDLFRAEDGEEFAPDMVVEIFEASHRFMIEGLKHSVENYMCNNLTFDNVCQLFQLADGYKSPFLLEECFDFILMHYSALKNSSEFREMNSELQTQVHEYVEKQSKKKGKTKPKKDDNYSLL